MGLLSYLVVPLLAFLALVFIKMDADYATYFASHLPNDYYQGKVRETN